MKMKWLGIGCLSAVLLAAVAFVVFTLALYGFFGRPPSEYYVRDLRVFGADRAQVDAALEEFAARHGFDFVSNSDWLPRDEISSGVDKGGKEVIGVQDDGPGKILILMKPVDMTPAEWDALVGEFDAILRTKVGKSVKIAVEIPDNPATNPNYQTQTGP
jgi:hypothetical protein